MTTELFIENKRLDLTEGISSLLTFSLDDIKDFASRNTTFSKTIVLPGTANNNYLFGFIFDAKISNPYDSDLDNVATNFNASVSANCLMFQDHIQIFKGTIRMLEIVINENTVEYECAVFGELGGLVSAIGSLKLEDLNFSAYDHTYNVTGITSSWNNTPGSGYYYPLIDYGSYSDVKHDWDFRTFRPALYVKEYLDKIFSDSGYTYQSSLFNTARFKELIVPHNQKALQRLTTVLLTGTRTSSYEVLNSSIGETANGFTLETFNSTSFTYSGGPPKYTYIGPTTLNITINYDIKGTRQADSGLTVFRIRVRKNGVDITSTLQTYIAPAFPVPYSFIGSVQLSIATGDFIEFAYDTNGAGAGYVMTASSASVSITVDAATYVPTTLGDAIIMADVIPKNILQKDFLSSIIRLFNLYVFEDRDKEKKLFIEPYVDFFDLNVSGVVDWNYKLDRSRQIKLKPMSEINSRYYEFAFKKDADYYNDLYDKRYNQTYGSYKYDSAYEFASESTKIELIFSGTPLVGYAGEDKIYSTIFKYTNGIEEKIDSNLRILQSKKITGVASWDIMDGATSLASYTNYGYAGHYDDPDAPANDIQFGVPAELFFTLVTGAINVTQFNVYWSSYMSEITDKDSKLLTAYFKLNSKDIYDLNFSKFIYVDGSFWRLNKITDWNASEPDVCQCELLKLINMIY